MAVACSSVATGTVRPHRSEVNTIRALMDLALPKFEGLGDRPTQVRRPCMVATDSPASPDPGCSADLLRLPSPCLNLDALSSDDAEDAVGLSDLLVTLICGLDGDHTPVNSDQVLSDKDLPAIAGSGDRRCVSRCTDCEYFSGWSGLRFPTESAGCGAPKGLCRYVDAAIRLRSGLGYGSPG